MDEESSGNTDNNQEPTATERTPRLWPEGPSEALKKLVSEIPPDSEDGVVSSDFDSQTVVDLTNAIIGAAIQQRASDVRIEPWSQILSVRFRIDGVLHEIVRMPKHLHLPTTNRLKVMADIPFWHKAPQTGYIPIHISTLPDKKRFNIAVTSAPTPHGDVLNLRILDNEMPHKVMTYIKEDSETEAALKQALYYGGLTLIVGTSGAGKTTTAYALMNRANWVGHVAATLETEQAYRENVLVQSYRKPGVDACQIAGGLLGQEAKVVFCGDLVDADMAEAALKLVEAGSSVIACVTAPHAAAAVLHLLKLGVAPARLAASLSGVLMQALVGLICPDCRASVPLDSNKVKRLERLRVTLPAPAANDTLPETLDYGEGCETCQKRGIKRRVALFDYLELDEVTRRLIRKEDAAAGLPGSPFTYASANALHEAARTAVLEKRISLDEAERVIYPLASAAQRML